MAGFPAHGRALHPWRVARRRMKYETRVGHPPVLLPADVPGLRPPGRLLASSSSRTRGRWIWIGLTWSPWARSCLPLRRPIARLLRYDLKVHSVSSTRSASDWHLDCLRQVAAISFGWRFSPADCSRTCTRCRLGPTRASCASRSRTRRPDGRLASLKPARASSPRVRTASSPPTPAAATAWCSSPAASASPRSVRVRRPSCRPPASTCSASAALSARRWCCEESPPAANRPGLRACATWSATAATTPCTPRSWIRLVLTSRPSDVYVRCLNARRRRRRVPRPGHALGARPPRGVLLHSPDTYGFGGARRRRPMKRAIIVGTGTVAASPPCWPLNPDGTIVSPAAFRCDLAELGHHRGSSRRVEFRLERYVVQRQQLERLVVERQQLDRLVVELGQAAPTPAPRSTSATATAASRSEAHHHRRHIVDITAPEVPQNDHRKSDDLPDGLPTLKQEAIAAERRHLRRERRVRTPRRALPSRCATRFSQAGLAWMTVTMVPGQVHAHGACGASVVTLDVRDARRPPASGRRPPGRRCRPNCNRIDAVFSTFRADSVVSGCAPAAARRRRRRRRGGRHAASEVHGDRGAFRPVEGRGRLRSSGLVAGAGRPTAAAEIVRRHGLRSFTLDAAGDPPAAFGRRGRRHAGWPIGTVRTKPTRRRGCGRRRRRRHRHPPAPAQRATTCSTPHRGPGEGRGGRPRWSADGATADALATALMVLRVSTVRGGSHRCQDGPRT